jgi:branched-subunit amino acid transport protein AzlD
MKPFLIILTVALVTAALRLLPVLLLGRQGRKIPEGVLYLSRTMPAAIVGLLVVYSLKFTQITVSPFGIPQAAGLAVAVLLQYWKRNTLLSVFAATAIYMVLIRVM